MNEPLRDLVACRPDRHRDGEAAVSCAELLDTVRRQGKTIPLSAALRIAKEALTAVDDIHEGRGPQPGDDDDPGTGRKEVSPRNLLIGPLGDVNFGARPSAMSAAAAAQPDSYPPGKLSYLAPEQVGGWALDRRCDLFSVGAVLYEMLTGLKLFTGGTDLAALAKSYEADLSAIAEPTARLPLELRLILASALAREPDERFQRASDFADAIRTFAQHARVALDAASFAGWLGTLDLWPARSGKYARVERPGLADTPVADAAPESNAGAGQARR
jgi:serine/threonine protein kinase